MITNMLWDYLNKSINTLKIIPKRIRERNRRNLLFINIPSSFAPNFPVFP